MLRISTLLRELETKNVDAESRRLPAVESPTTAPVVVWNLTRRCNLSCRYCYAMAADRTFPNELATREALAVLDDLQAFGVRALILSGGEPLLRSDCFILARRAKALGLHVALSSNGTLLDDRAAEALCSIGVDYVGISVDGIGATHDHIRGHEGAFYRKPRGGACGGAGSGG
ncbi:MAG: pqqEH [Rhodospirillaceae bacterium]|nr:MAG: pqqEH [Rhodospirillaceae bacterium]